MAVVHLYAVQDFVFVHAADKEVVQTVLGQIHVFQVCHTVYNLVVTVQVQVKTM
jgi:hypothetical protein